MQEKQEKNEHMENIQHALKNEIRINSMKSKKSRKYLR